MKACKAGPRGVIPGWGNGIWGYLIRERADSEDQLWAAEGNLTPIPEGSRSLLQMYSVKSWYRQVCGPQLWILPENILLGTYYEPIS